MTADEKTDALRRAKKRALYLLGERMYCRAELTAKLTRTYGEEIAGEAVEYITSLGYINDEEYAVKLAELLVRRKKHGIYRARREMLMKGLDRELCDSVLAGFSEEELDAELTELIEKKYYAKLDDPDDRRRTTAALVRRGYDFSSVRRCIEYVRQSVCEEFDDLEYCCEEND